MLRSDMPCFARTVRDPFRGFRRDGRALVFGNHRPGARGGQRPWLQAFLGWIVGASLLGTAAPCALGDGPKGTAAIKGKVTFSGEIERKDMKIAEEFCKKVNPKGIIEEATLVYKDDGNAMPFVFVWVDNIKDKYDAPTKPAVLDQRNCQYRPHVLGMIAGQPLDIISSDKTAHNVNLKSDKNGAFNKAQPNPGTISLTGSETFNKPEKAIKFTCNVHNWMSAWCHVKSHPFFDVTRDHLALPPVDATGAALPENRKQWGDYEIKGLPAGEYEVIAWHEKLGELKQKVSVKDGETQTLSFQFQAPKKAPATQSTKDDKKVGMVEPSRTITLSMLKQRGLAPAPAKAEVKPACCRNKAEK